MDESGSRGGDWPLVELAERHEGLLKRAELHALGVSDDAIFARVQAGRLHRRHQEIFSLGHRLLRPRGEWLAACWAVPGCVLSHQSAAAFHTWVPNPPEQHVTTIRKARSRGTLRVHRVEQLWLVDVERHPQLAVTTPARTICDLATVLPWPELRAIADRVRRLDLDAIRAAQDRAPNRPGAAKVRRLVDRLDAHTKSEFERRYLRFCRRHGVPLPDAVNAGVRGFLVDCSYEEQRLVVELDGRAFHSRQDQMRTDRRRDRKLLGDRRSTVRLVWEDLDPEDAAETAADLRRILAA